MTRTILWLTLLTAIVPATGSAQHDASGHAVPPPGEYTVSPESSWIRVLVFRGGLLGGLGHNHVVSAARIAGSVEIADPAAESNLHLAISYAALEVDDPAVREAEGDRFQGTVPADDIAGTRANMLGPKLLDDAGYDGVELSSAAIRRAGSGWIVSIDVTLLGETRQLEFPVDVEVLGDTLRATGSREVTHDELGLRPFTAALGTLRVRNEMTFRYSIVAVRHSMTE